MQLEDDKYIDHGDLIYAWSASFGPFIWDGGRAIYHYHIWKLEPFDYCSTNKHFLYNYLKAVTEEIKSSGSGIAMIHMTKAKMEELVVPLPPHEEQHRIVEKVDELMALCDRLEQQVGEQLEAHDVLVDTLLDALTRSVDAAEVAENWARIAEHFDTLFTTEASIDKLKQTILQLAVMGRLVEQDPEDEPASVLLERISKEKGRLVKEGKIKQPKKLPEVTEEEKPFELPKGWSWARLGNISQINPRNVADDEVLASFIPMPMITTSFHGEHDQETRSWGEIKKGYTHFVDGDIAIAKITPCFENSKAVVFRNLENGIGAGTTELHVARPYEGTLNSLFILLCLKSPRFLSNGEQKMTGSAGQKRVPKDFFSGEPLPFPPLAEQNRIVDKTHELMALCNKLNEEIKASNTLELMLADTLPKSLLLERDAKSSEEASSCSPSPLSDIEVEELSEKIFKDLNIEKYLEKPKEKIFKKKVTQDYTYDSLDLMIRGEHGDKGVEYIKLPALINAISRSVNNTLVGDLFGAFGIHGMFIKLSLFLLRKVFGETVNLDQWYALILMSFPEKDERSAKEIIERVNKKCRAAGVSGLDESDLSSRILHLTDLRIVSPHPKLDGVWKLTQRYKRSDYSS